MEAQPIPIVHNTGKSYGKIIFVCILFFLSLISFVTQTELTSYLYATGFNEPFLLLYLTHGTWWLIWPLQVISIAIYKTFLKYSHHQKSTKKFTQRELVAEEEQDALIVSTSTTHGGGKKIKKWKGFKHAFKSSVLNQHRNIFKTAEIVYELNDVNYIIDNDVSILHLREFVESALIKYICKTSLWIMILLNILGSSWYFAMTLTTSSDVTLIYNCSAFTAYAFAIIFLNERFSILKMSSVLFAIGGVIIVTYAGSNNDNDDKPYRIWGNIIILLGAVLYGLYEVVYKKYLCPPSNTVSSRRQALFSSFSMSIIGLMTGLVLWIPLVFVEIFHLHHFQIPTDLQTWGLILGSLLSNIIFSVAFLAMISLTSPVLSSVASLVTILFVGIAEWYIFHIGLSLLQVLGDTMVALGFVVLTIASWNEVSEEDTDEEENTTDMESVYSMMAAN